MDDSERLSYLEQMIHSHGWQIYINEIIGSHKDMTKGEYGNRLLGLVKKRKEETFKEARGFLRGLEFARDAVYEKIEELKRFR